MAQAFSSYKLAVSEGKKLRRFADLNKTNSRTSIIRYDSERRGGYRVTVTSLKDQSTRSVFVFDDGRVL